MPDFCVGLQGVFFLFSIVLTRFELAYQGNIEIAHQCAQKEHQRFLAVLYCLLLRNQQELGVVPVSAHQPELELTRQVSQLEAGKVTTELTRQVLVH